MADNKIKVGPWGGSGDGGNPWSFIPEGRITGISIRSAAVVDAICFSFVDGSGNTYRSVNFGGNGGTLHEIPFAEDEEIINISGRVGSADNCTVVTSLTFMTNKDTYGEYGTHGGTAFSLPVTEGQIIGFYGKHDRFLDSVGVILQA